MKYCPNCGAGVEPSAASCESCGAELSAVRDVVTPADEQSVSVALAALTVADLTPRQLRKEIRWGVFQGILLVAVIVFLVYLDLPGHHRGLGIRVGDQRMMRA